MQFYTKTHKHYCGIDLHARTMYLCVLDQEGEKLLHRGIRCNAEAFLKAIEPYREDLVVVLDRDELEEDLGVGEGVLEVGDEVQLQNLATEEIRDFTIIDVSDTEITLDGNHKLAGEDLTFEIEMVEIVKGVDEGSVE